MARQTRQQRRERRTKDGVAPAPAAPPRPPRAPIDGPVEPAAEGRAPAAAARRPAEQRGRFHFFKESIAELQKVEWPGQRQVVQGTVVVLVACLIVGVFLYASDQAFKHLVEQVFLR